ncbi:MAG: HAD-IB family phosphatase [Gemmatimonadota bacterium]|jgi:phosphoserine phosphatase|nr:HAD-IB family phosphatase [Gemmatimonadota bacterium]
MAVATENRTTGYTSIVFDCDSTLASIEGIDELAGPHADVIAALTDAAMDGRIPLGEVYGRRLEIIRPTRDQVEALSTRYVEALVEDARETVAALLWLGKDVRIVSGGLLPPVAALASELGVPSASVAAVGIEFTAEGEYSGFDQQSPLAGNQGKPVVLRGWSLTGPSMMVGDGSTDLEAGSETDIFVAYMGVAQRPKVAAAADVVLNARSLSPILALAAGEEDRLRLVSSPWADLLDRGDSLLG